MKKFLIVFVIVFILTFTLPFVSLFEKSKEAETTTKKQNEIVTIFNN